MAWDVPNPVAVPKQVPSQKPAATILTLGEVRSRLGPRKTSGVWAPPELGQSILASGSFCFPLGNGLSQRLWETGKGGKLAGLLALSGTLRVKVPFEVSLWPPREGESFQF